MKSRAGMANCAKNLYRIFFGRDITQIEKMEKR